MAATATAFCELNADETRIRVFFPYNQQQKDAVKAIKGARFVGRDKCDEDGPHWTVPMDMDAARALRTIFGNGLQLGDAVKAWARDEVAKERNLGTLTTADDATLKRVPKVAPLIAKAIAGDPLPELGLPKNHPLSQRRPPRPYQNADIAMMALANVLNANQPGTGKTLEVLGAVVEAALEDGPHLVVAPVRSLENVWRVEIERWLGHKVYTSEDPHERRKLVREGLKRAARGECVWVLVNFDMVRVKKIDPDKPEDAAKSVVKKDHKGNLYTPADDIMAGILSVQWKSFTIDEFHMAGLNNPLALFTLGTSLIRAQRHFRLSGTPMGGKPIRLFSPLRSIEPHKFSNKWDWINKWLEVTKGYRGHPEVGGILPGQEEAFYLAHARHMCRRLKRGALPGLPRKQIVEVPCSMTPGQRKQYEAFERDAEVRISDAQGEGHNVVANCILAEFTREKQFANAKCTIDANGNIVPSEDSGKLPVLLERLEQFGICKGDDAEPGARAIVSSEFKAMVYLVVDYLHKNGIACDALTGETKDSKPIIARFKGGDPTPYVIVMTRDTGGVSLNLEEAGSVHILDEHWNPDRMEQLEDRGDRGTRTTPLICLYYRTKGTVQEYIAKVAEGKQVTNANVLDVYRAIHKMRAKEA